MADIRDEFDRVVTQEQLTASQLKNLLEADVKVAKDIKLQIKESSEGDKSSEKTDKRIEKIAKLLEKHFSELAAKTNDDMKKAAILLSQLNKGKPKERSNFPDFSRSLLDSIQKIKINNNINISPVVKIPELRPVVNTSVVLPGLNRMIGVMSAGLDKLAQAVDAMDRNTTKGVKIKELPYSYGNTDTVSAIDKLKQSVESLKKEQRKNVGTDVNTSAMDASLKKASSSIENIDKALDGIADKIIKAVGSISPTSEARMANEIIIKAEMVRLEAKNIEVNAQNVNLKERVSSNLGSAAPPPQVINLVLEQSKIDKIRVKAGAAKGGSVEKTGVAVIHKGEAVITAGDALKLGKLADAGLKKGSIYVHDEIAHQYLKEISGKTLSTNGPTPRQIEDALKPLFDSIGTATTPAAKGKKKAADVGDVGADVKGNIIVSLASGSTITLDETSFKELFKDKLKTLDIKKEAEKVDFFSPVVIKANLIVSFDSGSTITLDKTSFKEFISNNVKTIDITKEMQGEEEVDFLSPVKIKANLNVSIIARGSSAILDTESFKKVVENISTVEMTGEPIGITVKGNFKGSFAQDSRVDLDFKSVIQSKLSQETATPVVLDSQNINFTKTFNATPDVTVTLTKDIPTLIKSKIEEQIGSQNIGKIDKPILVEFCADVVGTLNCPEGQMNVTLANNTAEAVKRAAKSSIESKVAELTDLDVGVIRGTVPVSFGIKIKAVLNTEAQKDDSITIKENAFNNYFKSKLREQLAKKSVFINKMVKEDNIEVPRPINILFTAKFRAKLDAAEGSGTEITLDKESFIKVLRDKISFNSGETPFINEMQTVAESQEPVLIPIDFKAAFYASLVQSGSTVNINEESISKFIRNKVKSIKLNLNKSIKDATDDSERDNTKPISVRIKAVINPYAEGDDIKLQLDGLKAFIEGKIRKSLESLEFSDAIKTALKATVSVVTEGEVDASNIVEAMKSAGNQLGDIIKKSIIEGFQQAKLPGATGTVSNSPASNVDLNLIGQKVADAVAGAIASAVLTVKTGSDCLEVCNLNIKDNIDNLIHSFNVFDMVIKDLIKDFKDMKQGGGTPPVQPSSFTFDSSKGPIDVNVVNVSLPEINTNLKSIEDVLKNNPSSQPQFIPKEESVNSVGKVESRFLEVRDKLTHTLLAVLVRVMKNCCAGMEVPAGESKSLGRSFVPNSTRAEGGSPPEPVEVKGKIQTENNAAQTGFLRNEALTPFRDIYQNIKRSMDSILGYNPFDKAFSGIVKEEMEFRRDLGEILFIQDGINKRNRDIQKQYEMHTGTVEEHAKEWKDIVAVTGQDLNKNLKNYLKLLKSGIKEQTKAMKITKIAGSLATATGISVENTGEMLEEWTNQLGLSVNQSSQLARGIRDISRLTGLTGENLEKAVKSSNNLVKKLRDAGNLSSDTARNFMVVAAQAQKLGVGNEVEKIVEGLTGGADFLEGMNGQLRDFLSAAAASNSDGGLIQEYIMGRGGERGNIKRTGSAIRRLVENLTGVEIENLDKLTGYAKTRADLVLRNLSGSTVTIGNVSRIIESLDTAGLSFAQRVAKLQSQANSTLSTTAEKALAQQQTTELVLSENQRIQTKLDEAIQKTPEGANRLSRAMSSLLNDLKYDAGGMQQLQKNLRSMGIQADSGTDILKESLEGTYERLRTELEGVGKLDLLKIKKEDINAALIDQSGKKFRQLLENLNESSQALTTQQRSQTDPMSELTQQIKELNASLRGLTGGYLSNFIHSVGKSGLLIGALAVSVGSLLASLTVFKISLNALSKSFANRAANKAAAKAAVATATVSTTIVSTTEEATSLKGLNRPFAGLKSREALVVGMFKGVQNQLLSVVDSIKVQIKGLNTEVISKWKKGFGEIGSTLFKSVKKVSGGILTLFEAIGSRFNKIKASIPGSRLERTINELFKAIDSRFGKITKFISESRLARGITAAKNLAIDNRLTRGAGAGITAAKNLATSVGEGISGFVSKVYNSFKTTLTGLGVDLNFKARFSKLIADFKASDFSKKLSQGINGVFEFVGKNFTAAKNFVKTKGFTGTVDSLFKATGSAFDGAKKFVSSNALTRNVGSLFEFVGQTFTRLKTSVVNSRTFGVIQNSATTLFNNIGKFFRGLSQGLGTVMSGNIAVVKGLRDSLPFLGKATTTLDPTKIFKVGLEAPFKVLGSATKPLVGALKPVFLWLGRIAGPLAVVTGLFEGITKPAEELGVGLSMLSGLLTGTTSIGSSKLGPNATRKEKGNAEALGVGMAALQGAAVGGFLGSFFGPIGAIIGSILGALAGVALELYKIIKFGGVLADNIKTMWNDMKKGFMAFKDSAIESFNIIATPIKKIFKDISDMLGEGSGNWGKYIEGFGKFVKFLGEAAGWILKIVSSGFAEFIAAAWEFLKPVVNGVIKFFDGIFDAIGGLISGDTSKVWDGLKNALLNGLETIVFAAIAYVYGIPAAILSVFGSVFSDVGAWFKDLGFESIGGLFENLGNIFKELKNVVGGLVEVIQGLFSWDFDKIKSGFNRIGEAFKVVLSNMWQGVKNLGKMVFEFIIGIPARVRSFFQSIDWREIGKDVANGIKNVALVIIDWFKKIPWKGILDGIVKFFAETKWTEVGKYILIGIGAILLGIPALFVYVVSAIAEGVFTAIGSIFDGIAEVISEYSQNLGMWFEGIGKVFSSIGEIFGGVVDVFSAVFKWDVDAIWAGLGRIWEGFVGLLDGIWGTIVGFVGSIGEGIIRAVGGVIDTVAGWFGYTTNFADQAVEMWNEAIDFVRNFFRRIPVIAANAWDRIRATFLALIAGIFDALGSIPAISIAGYEIDLFGWARDIGKSVGAERDALRAQANQRSKDFEAMLVREKQAKIDERNAAKKAAEMAAEQKALAGDMARLLTDALRSGVKLGETLNDSLALTTKQEVSQTDIGEVLKRKNRNDETKTLGSYNTEKTIRGAFDPLIQETTGSFKKSYFALQDTLGPKFSSLVDLMSKNPKISQSDLIKSLGLENFNTKMLEDFKSALSQYQTAQQELAKLSAAQNYALLNNISELASRREFTVERVQQFSNVAKQKPQYAEEIGGEIGKVLWEYQASTGMTGEALYKNLTGVFEDVVGGNSQLITGRYTNQLLGSGLTHQDKTNILLEEQNRLIKEAEEAKSKNDVKNWTNLVRRISEVQAAIQNAAKQEAFTSGLKKTSSEFQGIDFYSVLEEAEKNRITYLRKSTTAERMPGESEIAFEQKRQNEQRELNMLLSRAALLQAAIKGVNAPGIGNIKLEDMLSGTVGEKLDQLTNVVGKGLGNNQLLETKSAQKILRIFSPEERAKAVQSERDINVKRLETVLTTMAPGADKSKQIALIGQDMAAILAAQNVQVTPLQQLTNTILNGQQVNASLLQQALGRVPVIQIPDRLLQALEDMPGAIEKALETQVSKQIMNLPKGAIVAFAGEMESKLRSQMENILKRIQAGDVSAKAELSKVAIELLGVEQARTRSIFLADNKTIIEGLKKSVDTDLPPDNNSLFTKDLLNLISSQASTVKPETFVQTSLAIAKQIAPRAIDKDIVSDKGRVRTQRERKDLFGGEIAGLQADLRRLAASGLTDSERNDYYKALSRLTVLNNSLTAQVSSSAEANERFKDIVKQTNIAQTGSPEEKKFARSELERLLTEAGSFLSKEVVPQGIPQLSQLQNVASNIIIPAMGSELLKIDEAIMVMSARDSKEREKLVQTQRQLFAAQVESMRRFETKITGEIEKAQQDGNQTEVIKLQGLMANSQRDLSIIVRNFSALELGSKIGNVQNKSQVLDLFNQVGPEGIARVATTIASQKLDLGGLDESSLYKQIAKIQSKEGREILIEKFEKPLQRDLQTLISQYNIQRTFSEDQYKELMKVSGLLSQIELGRQAAIDPTAELKEQFDLLKKQNSDIDLANRRDRGDLLHKQILLLQGILSTLNANLEPASSKIAVLTSMVAQMTPESVIEKLQSGSQLKGLLPELKRIAMSSGGADQKNAALQELMKNTNRNLSKEVSRLIDEQMQVQSMLPKQIRTALDKGDVETAVRLGKELQKRPLEIEDLLRQQATLLAANQSKGALVAFAENPKKYEAGFKAALSDENTGIKNTGKLLMAGGEDFLDSVSEFSNLISNLNALRVISNYKPITEGLTNQSINPFSQPNYPSTERGTAGTGGQKLSDLQIATMRSVAFDKAIENIKTEITVLSRQGKMADAFQLSQYAKQMETLKGIFANEKTATLDVAAQSKIKGAGGLQGLVGQIIEQKLPENVAGLRGEMKLPERVTQVQGEEIMAQHIRKLQIIMSADKSIKASGGPGLPSTIMMSAVRDATLSYKLLSKELPELKFEMTEIPNSIYGAIEGLSGRAFPVVEEGRRKASKNVLPEIEGITGGRAIDLNIFKQYESLPRDIMQNSLKNMYESRLKLFEQNPSDINKNLLGEAAGYLQTFDSLVEKAGPPKKSFTTTGSLDENTLKNSVYDGTRFGFDGLAKKITPMESNIAAFTEAAMKKGSIYTHDETVKKAIEDLTAIILQAFKLAKDSVQTTKQATNAASVVGLGLTNPFVAAGLASMNIKKETAPMPRPIGGGIPAAGGGGNIPGVPAAGGGGGNIPSIPKPPKPVTPKAPAPIGGGGGGTITIPASSRAIPIGTDLTGATLPPPASPEVALTTLINRSSGQMKELYLSYYRGRQIAIASGIKWNERVGGSAMFPTYSVLGNPIASYDNIPLKINGTMVDPKSLSNSELLTVIPHIQRREAIGGAIVPSKPFLDELNRRRGMTNELKGMPRLIGNKDTTGKARTVRVPGGGGGVAAPKPPAPAPMEGGANAAANDLLRELQQKAGTGMRTQLGGGKTGLTFKNLSSTNTGMGNAGRFEVIVGPEGQIISKYTDHLTGTPVYEALTKTGNGVIWKPQTDLNTALSQATKGLYNSTQANALAPLTGGKAGSTASVSKGLISGGNSTFPLTPNIKLPVGNPIAPMPRLVGPPIELPSRQQTGAGNAVTNDVMSGNIKRILGKDNKLADEIIKGNSATTIGGVPVGYRDNKTGKLVPFPEGSLANLDINELNALANSIAGINTIPKGTPVPPEATLITDKFLKEVQDLARVKNQAGANVTVPAFNRDLDDLIPELAGLAAKIQGQTGGLPGNLNKYANAGFRGITANDLNQIIPDLSIAEGTTFNNPQLKGEISSAIEKLRIRSGTLGDGQPRKILPSSNTGQLPQAPGPNGNDLGFNSLLPVQERAEYALGKMRGDLGHLTQQATERGSIFTHDIHVQDNLSSLESTMASSMETNTYYSDMFLDRMDSMLVALEKVTALPVNGEENKKVEVQPVIPTGPVDAESDVRRRKVEEAAVNAPFQTEYLGEIAENTEEEAKSAKHLEKLLQQSVDALKAIKELLSPSQKGKRRGGSSTKDLFEEPFFDAISETEYLYDQGGSAPYDIESQYP